MASFLTLRACSLMRTLLSASCRPGLSISDPPQNGLVYENLTALGHGSWVLPSSATRGVTDRASSVHRTKAEAVAAGKELAKRQAPSQLLVYKKDGLEVQEEQTYR